jgi:1-acyl-sn-glycerol-3-phosphate acyltransferase
MLLWRARVLGFYILIALVTTLHVIPMLLFHWSSYRARYKIAISYAWSFVFLLKYICGMDYEIDGLENIPDGPAVVLANHQSFWDNMIMPMIFPMQTWVIKRELFKIPIFGLGLKIIDPIAVDRTKTTSVSQIIDDGTKKLKKGLWVVIFPESTRLRPGQTVPFKASGAKLAHMNGVPIIPVAHNAGTLWPKGFWIERPGVIKLKIGAPVYYKENQSARELNCYVENWINDTRVSLGG